MADSSRIGVMGLATMGQNLARNIAHHGIPIAVYNRTASRTEHFRERYGSEGPIFAAKTVGEFIGAIRRPRAVLLMVKAGAPVDEAIEQLEPLLEPGDILIDGGNSYYMDTRRRAEALQRQGLHFLGTGISGGEEGALKGPSIMPGGPAEAYREVEDILTAIAAEAEGAKCCTYIGSDGAGHYVKMVHNGIEYADMQLIAEAYDLLRQALQLDATRLAQIFAEWNEGDLESYLIQITAEVLRKRDEATGDALVDVIQDEAEQKGTGRWTSQSALELGVPVTAITEAVFARMLSAQKPERVHAATLIPGPPHHDGASAAGDGFIDEVRDALYASKVIAYAQGFAQLDAAAAEYGWNLNRGAIASIWRGGCIIRARFLNRIKDAYDEDPRLSNLMLAPYFKDALSRTQSSWRKVVALAVRLGVPVPAFASALAYYDGYRRERLPANLIQGLRDYFGAHTYQRVDREGYFHTRWGQDGREIPAAEMG